MNFQILSKRSAGICVLMLATFALAASAQTPTLVITEKKEMPVAGPNNLYCAGFVQNSPINTENKIVGAENEQDGHIFSQNNDLYINMGLNKGVNVGDIFAVVRPRGKVNTRWTKKGNLGFYVQEVGAVQIVAVKREVAVARVTTSCDNLLLGDLVQPIPARTSPAHMELPALNRFADPSGKALGRIFMARDNQEMLGREQIVYLDLGAEDNVQVGDRLTVFRTLGKGNLFPYVQPESVSARDSDYQSDVYRGGKFSNQAARKSGDHAGGRVVTTEKAKDDRPDNIRKIVGEVVVLNVKERTATAVITRTAQEIHTGDWVELQ